MQETSVKQVASISTFFRLCLPLAFQLVSCLDYFWTLKMEATCSSKTSVEFRRATQRYILDYRTLKNYELPQYILSKIPVGSGPLSPKILRKDLSSNLLNM
jgi:hypothetical protein